MKYISIILAAIFLFSVSAFSQNKWEDREYVGREIGKEYKEKYVNRSFNEKNIGEEPAGTPQEKKEEEVPAGKGVIYAGMSKEALYKAYPREYQTNYHKTANREQIAFDDWMSADPDDRITFYLVNRMVVRWKREEK